MTYFKKLNLNKYEKKSITKLVILLAIIAYLINYLDNLSESIL